MPDTYPTAPAGRRLESDRRYTDTREKVAQLHEQGNDARTIAIRLGISTQQVYRHLRAIEAEDSERAS